MASSPIVPDSGTVCDLLHDTLTSMVAKIAAPVAAPPPEVLPQLDDLLKRPSTMRDGMLTLLAYAVAAGKPLNYRELPKFQGARSVAQYVADDLLPSLNIAGKKDALQTGVKGVPRYIDRANTTWQETLGWASDQSDIEPVERAFRYLAAGMAATSRDVPSMPELDDPKLTFGAVFGLLDWMLGQPSGGSHEQFIFAALLDAYVTGELDEDGVVETKNINASDASAGTAGDVQHRHRGQVQLAFEVTANDWQSKVKQAAGTMTTHELRRVVILACGVSQLSGDEIDAELPEGEDIVVLDVREEIRSLVGRMGRKWRREALKRLYSLLVTKQSNDALVDAYVGALIERGLTVG